MGKSKVPSRLQKRFTTLHKKQIDPLLAQPTSHERSNKLEKLWTKRGQMLTKHRRQLMEAEYEKEERAFRPSKADKVTARNIKKVEGKRLEKLKKDLPIILQRAAKLHNETNLAFVNKILSNLI